jgi:signal transduction histidine kinase
LVGLDYASGPPFTFLLPATSVWAGMRFSPLLVSSHAVLGGLAVIWLTMNDHGLFAAGSASTRSNVLLAQMFVAMMIMIGLLLAAGRSESNRLHARLDDRQRALEAFARRAAHDLQQPLMVIDGWAGLLNTELAASSGGFGHPAPEVDMVHRIQTATTQMRGLVSNLLADATARDREVVQHEVDLARLARQVAESRGATDSVRVGAIPPVVGDEQLLRGVLDNLIGNALKYVVPGESAHIEVTGCQQLDGMVTVSVADRGIGLPAGSHEAVFDEFTRAHGDAYPGTGLGLSITRRIVERHGGDIVARSRGSGPGTVFEFRLPVWRSPETPAVGEGRSPALANSERQRS